MNSPEILKETLKRCPPETIEAALRYQRDRDPTLVPVIVLGIVERFVEPDLRPRVRSGDESLRLVEDLGVDSLLMVEIIIMVEETLGIQVANEEVRDLRTVGDIKGYVARKSGNGPAIGPRLLPFEEIAALMPQQDPFLFLREARIDPEAATATYPFTGRELFAEGHFKGNPVFPASLMIEALGQLAVLHLLATGAAGPNGAEEAIYFISCDSIRCSRIVRPGEVLRLSVERKRLRQPLAIYSGSIEVEGRRTASAGSLTLAIGGVPEPTGNSAVAASEGAPLTGTGPGPA